MKVSLILVWVSLILAIPAYSGCRTPVACAGVSGTGTRIPKRHKRPQKGLFPKRMKRHGKKGR